MGVPDASGSTVMIDKLVRYARIFASKSDFKFLLEKAAEFMFDLDKTCQDDRMTCTVRPLCEKRRWLSLLVKAGANMDALPGFCYELQQKIVERTLNQEKYFYDPEDCALFLDDFFLKVKKFSPSKLARLLENEEYDDLAWHIESFLRSKFSRVASLNLGEVLIILADDHLWFFDFLDKYVIMNLNDERISNQANLLSLVKLFNKHYKHEVKVFESSAEEWVLDAVLFEITSPGVAQDESLKKVLAEEIGKMAKLAKSVNFKIEENKARLLMRINAFCGFPETMYSVEPVAYGEVLRLYLAFTELKKKMHEWVSENVKQVKGAS